MSVCGPRLSRTALCCSCRKFSEIYTDGEDLLHKMWNDAFEYTLDEANAYTMWWFEGGQAGMADAHDNPNDLITQGLGQTVPDQCHLDYWHKDVPTPEDETFTECHPWHASSCCHNSTVVVPDNLKKGYGAGYEWDRCGPLSQACERFFIQEGCFYECEVNAGLYRKFTDAQHDACSAEGVAEGATVTLADGSNYTCNVDPWGGNAENKCVGAVTPSPTTHTLLWRAITRAARPARALSVTATPALASAPSLRRPSEVLCGLPPRRPAALLRAHRWQMYKMPIKASFADAWYRACANDLFCGTGDYFSCAGDYHAQIEQEAAIAVRLAAECESGRNSSAECVAHLVKVAATARAAADTASADYEQAVARAEAAQAALAQATGAAAERESTSDTKVPMWGIVVIVIGGALLLFFLAVIVCMVRGVAQCVGAPHSLLRAAKWHEEDRTRDWGSPL